MTQCSRLRTILFFPSFRRLRAGALRTLHCRSRSSSSSSCVGSVCKCGNISLGGQLLIVSRKMAPAFLERVKKFTKTWVGEDGWGKTRRVCVCHYKKSCIFPLVVALPLERDVLKVDLDLWLLLHRDRVKAEALERLQLALVVVHVPAVEVEVGLGREHARCKKEERRLNWS